jgi:hypothetical protein
MATKTSAQDFTKKWSTIAGQFGSQVPYPVLNQVYQLDRQHLQSQGYDYSQTELENMIASAASGKSITAPPDQGGGNFFSNVLGDVKSIGTGLMGLVKTGLGDIEHPSHIGAQVSTIWRDPNAVLQNVVPGLADIETVLKADPHLTGSKGAEKLLQHPVTSVLDVLPIGKALGAVAGKLGRVGLDEAARSAAEEASRYKPSDYSPEARAARASAKTQVSRARQLAIASEKGLPHLLRESVLGGGGNLALEAPAGFDFETGNSIYSDQWIGNRGERLANFLNRRSGGRIGSITADENRRLAPVIGQFLHARAEIANKRNHDSMVNLWWKHGLSEKRGTPPSPEVYDLYQKLWNEGATKDEVLAQAGPELGPKINALFDDLQARYTDNLNADLAGGKVAQVIDPRDGRVETRATRGRDNTVVRASKLFEGRRSKAQGVLADFNATHGTDIPLDPSTARQAMVDQIVSRLSGAAGPFVGLDTENLDALRQAVEIGKRTQAADLRFAKKVLGPSGSLNRFLEAIKTGDLETARKILGTEGGLLSNLTRKSFHANPLLRQIGLYLRSIRPVLDGFKKVESELKKFDRSKTTLTSLIDRNPSAEYQKAFNEIVKDQALLWLSHHREDIDPEALTSLYDDIGDLTYRGKKFSEIIGPYNFRRIKDAAIDELVSIRNEGFRPRFAYSTAPENMESILSKHPNLERISAPQPGFTRAEVVPSRLYDPVIGLMADAERRLEHDFATEYWFGKNGVLSVHGMGFDDAKSIAMQSMKIREGSFLSKHASLDREMKEKFEKVDPRSLFSSAKAVATGVSFNADVYVPRDIMAAVRANFDAMKPTNNPLIRGYARATGIFKYSLLNFSPRYQMHIAGGGSMLLLLRGNIWEIVPNVSAALGMAVQDTASLQEWATRGHVRRTVIQPLLDHFTQKAERLGQHGIPGQIAHSLPEADTQGLQQAFAYASGHKIGKWLDEAMSKRGLSAGLEVANFNANMLRALAYLSKGGGEEGIAFANKVFADMNSLTPAERSLIKYVIPFYGWTRHILKFVSTYPADHPYRAMVLANATQQYWEEWDSGFPQKLIYLFSLGTPDAQGNVKVDDLRQLDPLRNVVDIFTMAGAMSALNPAFQTMLQGFGIDPVTAQPDNIYSTFTYDSFSGALQANRPSPLQLAANGVFNFIPESSVLDHFLQLSSYTRYLAQNEPALYRQQLYQALNVPWVPYNVNVYQTIARTEAHQYTVAKDLVQTTSGTGAMYSADPNSADWGALFKYAYVPYQSWMVQPAALRYWVFMQAPVNDGSHVYTGYLQYRQSGGTLPPASVIVPPSSPRSGANPYQPPFAQAG